MQEYAKILLGGCLPLFEENLHEKLINVIVAWYVPRSSYKNLLETARMKPAETEWLNASLLPIV